MSWNVHVGGGDIVALVEQLRAGALTAEPISEIVLLLQESFRASDGVPASIAIGARAPKRISPSPPHRQREDIAAVGARLGLSVYYVPSMRNGFEAGTAPEDRGNAILSTLPLSDFAAIPLPFAHQRRVAVSARVSGEGSNGPWTVRVVSAHLDAAAGSRDLWLLTSTARARQARSLRTALDDSEETILGADLNTWSEGPAEPAVRELRRVFPGTPAPRWEPTFQSAGRRLRLDYLFTRLPKTWSVSSRRLDDRFGSDHYPLLAVVQPR